jgi:hypothetical protein
MGSIMQTGGCKSLIPVGGVPCLSYVLEALRRIDCTRCLLCIDRDNLHRDVEQLAVQSRLPFKIIRDSGRGPTSVALEAAKHVCSDRFLMLHGHQIVFPDHLARMIAQDHDVIGTVYKDSSEGVRKIATLDEFGCCVNMRRGSSEAPATEQEVYLDKPYILETIKIRSSLLSDTSGDPTSPVDAELRPHTVFRYARAIYTLPADFRHEYHYQHELPAVIQLAKVFQERYLGRCV